MTKCIFIIGSPHSGTTWINNWLCEHPCITGHEETYFLTYLIEAFKSLQSKGWIDKLKYSTIQSIYTNAICQSDDIILMHDNHLIRYALELEQIFPSAHYLVFHRDGRRVAASIKNRTQHLTGWRDSFSPTSKLVKIERGKLTKRWAEDMNIILNGKLPQNSLVMKYNNIANSSQKITEFIGVDHHGDINPNNLVNCSFGITKDENYWKEFLSKEDQEHFVEIEDLLKKAGYDISD